MTREMVHQIAEQVLGPLQWLTEEEEWLVMEIVTQKLREKRR